MARPTKNTVDYFPHDADASEGRTVSILENQFGSEGYSTWFKLLERISRTNNHVILCRNGEDTEFLAAKMRMQPGKLREILDKMADLGAIDAELWREGVIWSDNYIQGIKNVYTNRRQPLPSKPPITTQNNDITTDTLQPITELNTVVKRQSRVKYTRVNKKSKEINIPLKQKFGEFLNVFLATAEHEKLTTKFGKEKTDKLIETLSSGIESKGYKYKSHYAAILNWEKRDYGTDRGDNKKTGWGNPQRLPETYTRVEADEFPIDG